MHDGSGRAEEGEPGKAAHMNTLRRSPYSAREPPNEKKKNPADAGLVGSKAAALFAAAALLILLLLRRRLLPACTALTACLWPTGAVLTAPRRFVGALVRRRRLAAAA